MSTQSAQDSRRLEPIGFQERLTATQAILRHIATQFSPAVLASSLAAEDMVLTDLILKDALSIGIFSLETGRLHQETLAMLDKIKQHYGYEVALFRPQNDAVDRYVEQYGLNGFYDSVEARKACCHVRKVEPLGRALQGKQAWITGQRRAQSTTRSELAVQEHDAAHGLEKFNPLADWSEDDVWYYLQQFQVPYNGLHDKGYPSIGCEPCTRAIQPGEDIRAGRWWWENPESKECGLHLVDGKLIRIKQVG
ncbi:phosphoadenylyl-sulfate reductase [Undibacterium cyanobacteriorum]|uniref:Adenosine 5'-phosphosulfate reductase n=1 Tax=Undibacterium cyanobacteriorum TaxID=3073561 RepID=A0ABY9RKK3_9BURK|nr:phosphoadenylyl-sulfate reductase [Undibacterium sp. 20NA77.5]WMW81757.1 phosphoadenylyl-sulfate reductase [Undibacterium sp. 20NA77.5]